MQEPDRPREWVSLRDADGDDWHFDLTFLTSDWACIFGRGCQGVLTGPAPELEQGCCSYGAHMTGEDDVRRVESAAARLDNRAWQHRSEALRRGGAFKRSGDQVVSRLVGDACIFLNRPGFAGGAGCALHRGALEAGERPLDWKPDVCWQVPLRVVSHVDENGRTVTIVREWDRRDWGAGGEEFHWWCTESDEAFVGSEPVYRAMRDELIECVGDELYEELVSHIESSRPVEVALPAIRRTSRGT